MQARVDMSKLRIFDAALLQHADIAMRMSEGIL